MPHREDDTGAPRIPPSLHAVHVPTEPLAHTPQPRQDFDPRHQTRHPDHRDLHCTTTDAMAWARGLGHVWRMPEKRLPKQLLTAWLPQKRPVGRPELTYGQTVVRTVRAVEAAGGLAARSAPRFGACRFLLLADYENLAAPLFALSQ